MQSTVFLPITRPGRSRLDAGQLGRPGGEGIQGGAHPRDDAAPQVGAAPVHHLDGRGRPQIHQDQGGLILRQRGHGDDDAVAAHLGGDVHLDVQGRS